ncbi:MAG TPA: aromatic ring-hydroxylating dioxygenase subunit alpha [Albitalea sp.]|nr:aromatic ring-hydroxylating dioxygenase subunit alpha [Albitalea sp.]
MSDLTLPREITEARVRPLPASSYFDAALFAREMDTIFQHGPRYLGHELAVPEPGDYYTLPQEREGRALVRTPQSIELISNVCRHRQALIMHGRGNTQNHIVCPLHRWTYDLKGQLIGAPHFAESPCLHLNNYRTRRWNGLVFEDNGRDVAADMAGLGALADFDFSGHVLDRVYMHECAYNWKSFIEVYLEDYHVGPFHPGLGNFVTTDDLRWEMGREYSVQTVGVATAAGEALGKPGSDVYRQWHDAVLAYQQGTPPKYGAVWLTYYPGVMLEWYPNVLVVSTLYPRGPQKTTNVVEFYYPEEIAAFERDYVEAQQAAYLETCVEDDEIALRMDAGRCALMDRGDDEFGPYQSPMEDGMRQFHAWYRRAMG